jgi:hypothetical protein
MELRGDIEKLCKGQAKILEWISQRREGAGGSGEWMTRKDICEAQSISPSTLDRRVLDGTIERSYHLGAGSPRFRIVGNREEET